jgi:hypothetical protein
MSSSSSSASSSININDRNYCGLMINGVLVYDKIAWSSARLAIAREFEQKSRGGWDVPSARKFLAAALADGLRPV